MSKFPLEQLLLADKIQLVGGRFFQVASTFKQVDGYVHIDAGSFGRLYSDAGHAFIREVNIHNKYDYIYTPEYDLAAILSFKEDPKKASHRHIGNAEELIKYLNTVASINNTIGSIDTDTFPSSMDAKVLCLDTIKAAITECNRVYGLDVNNK